MQRQPRRCANPIVVDRPPLVARAEERGPELVVPALAPRAFRLYAAPRIERVLRESEAVGRIVRIRYGQEVGQSFDSQRRQTVGLWIGGAVSVPFDFLLVMRGAQHVDANSL